MGFVALKDATSWLCRSVEHAALVGWDHILDVDERVFTSVNFEHLEGRLDQFSKVLPLSLAVVDLVTEVVVLGLHQVHDWQNLTVVWHQGFSDSVRAGDQTLQDLKGDSDNFWVACVQGG